MFSRILFALLLLSTIILNNECRGDVRKVVNGRTYVFVRGSFTQRQAWDLARSRGGKPVVFSTMREHTAVIAAFGLGRSFSDIAWTGHYQRPDGREPGLGWMTYGSEGSAPLSQLFNSNGPDDGIRNKWGWASTDDGFEIWYGPSAGKNEDGALIWGDAAGKLEDVSVNHRANLLIEF